MLSSTANISPALPASPPPAGSAGIGNSGDGDSFAQALNDATPSDPKPAAKTGNTRAKTRSSESTDNKRERVQSLPAERVPGAEASADGQPSEKTDSTEDGPVRSDDVRSLLADMQALHNRSAAPASAPTTAAAGKEPAADATPAASKLQALPREPLRHAAADGTAIKANTITPAAEREARSDSVAAVSTERNSARAETTLLLTPQLAPGAAAAPAQQGALQMQGAEATLSAAPNSAEFAPQFAATVSTFVRDGIEHAKLHLNPAEMGPVNVQIQIEGNNAQVLMSAEQALTRQALEQSLPLLASSLREAGLTLAGGGVFEQHRNGSGEPSGRDNRGGTPHPVQPEPEPSRRTAVPMQRRGVVDLIA